MKVSSTKNEQTVLELLDIFNPRHIGDPQEVRELFKKAEQLQKIQDRLLVNREKYRELERRRK